MAATCLYSYWSLLMFADTEADADVKALTLSASGGTGAHQGAEGDAGGVQICGDLGPQSRTTAQQVRSVIRAHQHLWHSHTMTRICKNLLS